MEEKQKLLVLMCGLPRSGKTTQAKEMSARNGWPIVNPDSIRLALHGQRFAALAEPFVWAIARVMARALFLAGHDHVIVDATNTTRARRDEWKSKDWERGCVLVATDKETCLARAAAADDADIVPIIEKMAAQYEPPTMEEGLIP